MVQNVTQYCHVCKSQTTSGRPVMSHAKRVTKVNRKNQEYHVVVAIRRLLTHKNSDRDHHHLHFSGWPVGQPITSLLATPCWRDPARWKQLCPVVILGFQFGLYHVVPLSFLRSNINQLCIIVTFLVFIFSCSDLSQILRKPATFSFAVLCIIVFRLLSQFRTAVFIFILKTNLQF